MSRVAALRRGLTLSFWRAKSSRTDIRPAASRTVSMSERTRTNPASARFGNIFNVRHARYILRRFQVRDHKAKAPFASATSDHLGKIAGNLLAFIFAGTGNAVFTRYPHSLAS